MRQALRQVRDAQGPDAVILSSRRVPDGVEVVAAIDYDGEEAATDIVVDGNLPFSFSGIRAQFTALAQAEDAGDALVDPMFEIPVEIVRSVIDYKPYDKNARYDGRYMLLEGLDTPWWKRWTVGG